MAPGSNCRETEGHKLTQTVLTDNFSPTQIILNSLIVQQHIIGIEVEDGGIWVSFNVVVHAGQLLGTKILISSVYNPFVVPLCSDLVIAGEKMLR